VNCGFDFDALAAPADVGTSPLASGAPPERQSQSMAGIDCPRLHPDQVRKVSAIVTEGTAESSISVPADGGHLLMVGGKIGYVGGYRGGVAHQVSSTWLADALAPPRLPPDPRNGFWRKVSGVGAILFGLACGYHLVTTLAGTYAPGYVTLTGPELDVMRQGTVIAAVILVTVFGLVGLLLLGSGVSYARRDRMRYEDAMHRYRSAFARWERLEYCKKCDVVFDPSGSWGPVPPARLPEYLNS